MLSPQFLEQVALFDKRKQSLFCLALLQRMAPNYQLFCQSVEFHGEAQFSKLLGLFWEALIHPKTKFNAAVQQERFEDAIPDPEHFDMYGVYPALDCCVLVDLVFSCLLEFNGEQASQASQTSMAGVYSLLELQHPELDEAKLSQLPLAQEERDFQQALFEHIENLVDNSEGINKLRRFSCNEGVSNLGIELG